MGILGGSCHSNSYLHQVVVTKNEKFNYRYDVSRLKSYKFFVLSNFEFNFDRQKVREKSAESAFSSVPTSAGNLASDRFCGNRRVTYLLLCLFQNSRMHSCKI